MSRRRPLNKAVTPSWMNCTSVAYKPRNEGGGERGRSRARNHGGACKVTHATDRRRRARPRESAISRTHSKACHPDTCCRSIRSMISYAKLTTRQKVGQSARCEPRGRSEAARGERKEDRLWAFFPILLKSLPLPPFPILHVRKSIGPKRGREDDYARLFNTKGSKTNTEIR